VFTYSLMAYEKDGADSDLYDRLSFTAERPQTSEVRVSTSFSLVGEDTTVIDEAKGASFPTP
jgi:hypothetical protein